MLVLFNMQTDKRTGSSKNFDRIKFQDIVGTVKIEIVQHKLPFNLESLYRDFLNDCIFYLQSEISIIENSL